MPMPSTYAHYRFGKEVLREVDENVFAENIKEYVIKVLYVNAVVLKLPILK